MAKLKVGDRIVFGRCKSNKDLKINDDVTIGKIYTISGQDAQGDLYFKDDKNHTNYCGLIGQNSFKVTKIVD